MFWCWLQELVCSCADIVPASDEQHAKCEPDAQQSAHDSMQHQHQILQHTNCDAVPSSLSAPNPAAMFRTIAALLAIAESSEDSSNSSSTKQTHATNTNSIDSQCEGSSSIDEIDHYTQYFKDIGIHFQKTAIQLLNQQHPSTSSPPPPFDSCSADILVVNDDIDSDHRNEYSFIDDDGFDCRASNASANPNDCDEFEANNYAMQSSLCHASSASNTNQQQSNAHYDHELGLDCNSSSNCMINRIANCSASNNSNDDGGKSTESNSIKRSASVQIRRKTPNTLNLNLSNNAPVSGSRDIVSTKKRKISNLKRSYKQMNSAKMAERQALNEITEECEYDSDIGKFNCKPSADQQQQQLMSDTSSGSYEFSDDSATIQTIGSPSSNDEGDGLNLNDLNLTPKQRNLETAQSIELLFNINGSEKIVTKRIEFFENISGKPEEIEQDLLEHKQEEEEGVINAVEPKKHEKSENNTNQASLNDIICFTSFVFAIVFMYFFPVLC